MRLLLDTHAFLWFVLKDARLSATALSLIADPSNRVELSPASIWEIAIKISIGKYSLNEPLLVFMDRELPGNQLDLLPILVRHLAILTNLPFHHKDPFDCLIIAQAMVEQIPVVSGDAQLDAYSITRLW